MPGSAEGEHQPTEKEQRIIDRQMPEGSFEKAGSDARSETHEFRNTSKSNLTEGLSENAVKNGKEAEAREIDHFAKTISEKIVSFQKNPDGAFADFLGFPFIPGDMEKYTEWVGGPEAWIQRIGEKAGLGNSDVANGILGEKDGVRVKSEIRYSGVGTGIHLKLEKM